MKIENFLRGQFFEATDGKAVRLIVVVAVERGIIVVQVAVPGVRSIVLKRSPEVAVVRAIVERAGVPVAGARK